MAAQILSLLRRSSDWVCFDCISNRLRSYSFGSYRCFRLRQCFRASSPLADTLLHTDPPRCKPAPKPAALQSRDSASSHCVGHDLLEALAVPDILGYGAARTACDTGADIVRLSDRLSLDRVQKSLGTFRPTFVEFCAERVVQCVYNFRALHALQI